MSNPGGFTDPNKLPGGVPGASGPSGMGFVSPTGGHALRQPQNVPGASGFAAPYNQHGVTEVALVSYILHYIQ